MPIMPNIGPLTAYGHPSTRYKSIDRNIKKTISSSKNSNKTDSILPDEEMNDPDPDPFVSQRKIKLLIKLLVVPDAYAAAPIQVKSHGVFETSTEKIVIAEKLPQSQASELVQDSLETFSTPKNSPSSTNTHHKITSESITPLEIPSTKTKLVSTESSSLSPTTKTNVPEISVATVAVAEKLPIIQTSESNEDSLKSFPATIIFSSPTEIPTLTHHEIMTSESVSAVPITVPSTTTTSQSTESSHLSPTAKINVPRNPSKSITIAQKLPIIQTSESESLATNTNNTSELVQDSLETFSTPTNAPTSKNTHQEITSESTAPFEIPSTKTKLVSTESSSLSPTTKTNVPEISVATVAVAEKLPISQTSESNKDSLKTFPATIISSSPTEIPTLTHHEIITSESVSAIPITVPSMTTTSQSIDNVPTTKINVPKNPSESITTAQKLPIIQTSESESLVTNTNNSDLPKNTEINETSAELLNKETFNEEGSDYDNDVFARLKDDVELIGDNPRSALSESIPRPTLVHPQKSNNKFLHRLFAAPSEAEADEIETENTEEEEIIPEVAFPLPNCYRTAGGFLCCNRVLEELIYRSNSVIQRKQLSECNVHAFAAHLQQEAEKMFKTTFEIVLEREILHQNLGKSYLS
uniref:Zonadhesin n=1 Tax=Panagrolaimus sp. PS1159 TaxID=55785 RepID=A0AC35FGM0_9BILA